jgi:bacterial/archaeal transporter family-2 protein
MQVTSIVLALLAGALVAVQSALLNIAGKQIGAINTGLLSLSVGGLVAIVILFIKRGLELEQLRTSGWYVLLAGSMGIVILTSIAFVVQRIGVTAGLAGLILAQLVVAFLIDTFGWGGPAIPFELRRVLGLALLAVGVYLVLPRG